MRWRLGCLRCLGGVVFGGFVGGGAFCRLVLHRCG